MLWLENFKPRRIVRDCDDGTMVHGFVCTRRLALLIIRRMVREVFLDKEVKK
jgi:hypothetical protein